MEFIKESMQEYKHLETTNERDFFISANIMFEKLFEKFKYPNKKGKTHSSRMDFVFNELKVLEAPALDNIHNFLKLLNKYRNELAHKHKAEKDIEILKRELLEELKKSFIELTNSPKNFIFNQKNIKGTIKDTINEVTKQENSDFFDSSLESNFKSIFDAMPDDEKNKPIDTFDNRLFAQIIMIYGGLNGFFHGLSRKNQP